MSEVINYGPRDVRPSGSLCVLFYKETYTVRLYSKEQDVYDWACATKACYAKEVFTCANDLAKIFSVSQLNQHLRELTTRRARPLYDARDRACRCPENDPHNPHSVAAALWTVLQTVGDPCTRAPGYSAVPDEDRWRFDLDKINSPEGQAAIALMPKQARQLLKEAVMQGWKAVDEDRLRKDLTHMVMAGRLRTRQDPYKILSYYSGPMHEGGFVQYPGRRDQKPRDNDEEGNQSQAA